VIRLLEEGRGDKVLMAHDIHTKHRLVSVLLYLSEETCLTKQCRYYCNSIAMSDFGLKVHYIRVVASLFKIRNAGTL
jgi:hypothetical protein